MIIKLLADLGNELKKLWEGKELTINQLFYFVLVVGKLVGMFKVPWCMVLILPLASPMHIKAGCGVCGGMVKTAFNFVSDLAMKALGFVSGLFGKVVGLFTK